MYVVCRVAQNSFQTTYGIVVVVVCGCYGGRGTIVTCEKEKGLLFADGRRTSISALRVIDMYLVVVVEKGEGREKLCGLAEFCRTTSIGSHI